MLLASVLEASLEGGKVICKGFEIPEATVMSEGNQDSQGILFIQGEIALYFPSSATDIKTSLEKISSSLEQIANALTSIDSKPTGGSGSAVTPSATSNIAQIQSIKAELDTLKEALK